MTEKEAISAYVIAIRDSKTDEKIEIAYKAILQAEPFKQGAMARNRKIVEAALLEGRLNGGK